jgi:2-C-methyl-D-erythritol 2,4-cyclodiphosphate synthase
MQTVIAEILSLQITDVSIKATTTEKMGFVGREEGLVAYASILLNKKLG